MAENCTQNQTLPLIRPPRSADSWTIGVGGFGGGLKNHVDGAAEALMHRNGWAAGFVQLEMDRLVGSHYRLQSRPDHILMGITEQVSSDAASQIEREWEMYSNSTGCFPDAARRRTFTQILREAVRSEVLYGEVFLVRQWRQSPSGYSTCFQLVSPARVSNPNGTMNTETLRNGIELNKFGEPIAYWIRNRHPGDPMMLNQLDTWDRITRFNRFGIEQVIHVTDQLAADQTRGISRFAPIVGDLERLDTYEKAEEEAALLGAIYTMAITSEYGQQSAFDALGIDSMRRFIDMQAAFHGEASINFQGSKIPHLMPGEKLEAINSSHPNIAYKDHRNAVLGRIARGSSCSFEEFTGDFTQTTYSSARASVDVADRGVRSKRANFVDRVANKMFSLWLYEALIKQRIPSVTSDAVLADWRLFYALSMSKWVGPPRIVVDPFKNAKANEVARLNGTLTLADACAEDGNDWEDIIAQRKREQDAMMAAGLMQDPSEQNTDDVDDDETPPQRNQNNQVSQS